MFESYNWFPRYAKPLSLTARKRNPSRRSWTRPRIESLEDRLAMAGVMAGYAVTQDWGSGFQGQISLQNQTSASVANWRLEFDYAAKITSIWDAKITSQVGNHYVVTNAGWNSNLAAGSSVSFGFVAQGNVPANPIHYVLNGVSLDGAQPPAPPPLPNISILDAGITEGNSGSTNVSFAVELSAAAASAVVVSYVSANGTAQSGSDYTAASGKLTFAVGETRKLINISVAGDTTVENDETFSLTLSGLSGATLARATATGTIRNDDTAPPVLPPATGDFQFSVPTDWGSGFTGGITARNSTGNAINSWTLAFDFAGQITSIWDAKIVSHTGNHYVVSGESWNNNVAAGATVSFGFNGARANTGIVPTGFAWGGTPVSNPGGNPGGGTTDPGSGTLESGINSWPTQFSAPYVDMTLYPMYDLTTTARTQGIKFFTLAFITADPHNNPAWGGFESYGVGNSEYDAQMKAQINGVRGLGGDVMVSFGGASNHELAEVITDPTALKVAYQKVIDAYKLTHIDFDIEGGAMADRAAVDRRSQAVAALQRDAVAAGRTLDVWFTLPVLPTGLTNDGMYVVQSALRYGVNIAGINIMAMDYGDSAAPNPQGLMGDYSIAAGESLFSQLKSVYGTTKTDAQLWQMIGITPMIGMNDVQTEIFDQQEARELLAWAEQHQIARISYWSLNRDKQNSQGTLNHVDLTSSSVLQTPYEFALIFDQIKN
jgi:hypothetical protein